MHEAEDEGVSSSTAATPESVDECVDTSVDDSTRGRLVAALTDAVRRMIAEGDGEGARVALRALEEIARLVGTETRTEDRVADLDAARARIRKRDSSE